MASQEIADYALLSDCRSAALVSRDGSVDWLCFPRFDSPAVFAGLLDDDGGHWFLRPVEEASIKRRYLDRSMALETTYRTATGEAVVLDAMSIGPNTPEHDLAAQSPGVLLRQVTCTEGRITFAMGYAPRPEYGLIHPLLHAIDGGVVARGGADILVFSSPVEVELGEAATTEFELSRGQSHGFALQHRTSSQAVPDVWSSNEVAEGLSDVIANWQRWSTERQNYDGPWSELVTHSGRVLHALSYQPTGAIVAAPTTSLPETVGGSRNWDYRYTWVRDASLTLEALWVAACPDDASNFFTFLTRAAATSMLRGNDLPIMFGIGGERDLSERSLPHLRGWRDSTPVRVGNGAWNQRQLDVYGELLGAAHRFRDHLGDLDTETRQFLVSAVEAAMTRWTESDQGIWEIRGEPRHYLYSKLMCWVALDRGIELAEILDAQGRIPEWRAVREEIATAIFNQGWSDTAQAFTQSFGSDHLDASVLMLPIVGFLPADHPKVRATVDAIAERLTDDHGLVFRYLADDGLEGEEGTFLLCTFWLAQAQALIGETGLARKTFELATSYANDVGLLAEEVDPAGADLLGNFPQAFSHIGLINAAWAISQAECESVA
ncbi:glycoside hydrolase family 15 protein [Ornithinimicrobium sp. Arc0846-15]|nr:glycoside hydrolase family 15 protein [Ornithinimicrobium laminariae]